MKICPGANNKKIYFNIHYKKKTFAPKGWAVHSSSGKCGLNRHKSVMLWKH